MELPVRRVVSAVAVLGLAVAGTAAVAPRASAAAPATLDLVGHGWGHGRGMGQYGAYGYALAGWSYQQILAQYYGGTSLAPTDGGIAATPISVRLDELDGAATTVQGPGISASWAGGSIGGPTITVTHTQGGLTVTSGITTVPVAGDVTIGVTSGDVQVSIAGGWRSYRGQLLVKAAVAQTLNLVSLDQYVAGVVPSESPASWGLNGEAALQAQAVAARSYALASIAVAGVICDTPYCQVYEGDQDAAGTPSNSIYTTYSDQAVATTSGQVLRCATATCGTPGSVAYAEFSSSTGGWTAGGAFTAAVDAGDATPSNPNHTWSTTVASSAVTAAWPSIGALQGVAVTSRNGLGDLGGRVLQIELSGTAGHVAVTGDQFAAAMGLDSDWFQVTNSGLASGGLDGYWIVGSDGAVYPYGNAAQYGSTKGLALNAPVVGMAPSADDRGYWIVAGDGGIFSYGDAVFHGSTGGLHLNRPVIGMAPTPTGGGYWLFAGDGGVFSFGDARFFGSTGGMRLNRPIVGMASTPDGGGYWLVASDGGIFAFGDARFWGSAGSLPLAQPVVGMVPTADGGGYTLVARDGGIFSYGDAAFLGSLPGLGVTDTVAAVTPTADGKGYLVLAQRGAVYAFGDAPYFGDQSSVAGWSGSALTIFGHRG